MTRPIVDPVETQRGDNTVLTHPAFAQITLHRVHGRVGLYGSDFEHAHTMQIEVRASYLERHLANDWPHQNGPALITLAMSEGQWATFVSSVGIGQGVQCTLDAFNGEMIPGLPVRDTNLNFAKEAAEAIAKVVTPLEELRRKVEEASTGLSQKKAAALVVDIDAAIRNVRSNLPHIAEQFGEHMEKRVERAKTEIHAHVAAVQQRFGALASIEAPIALPAPAEKPTPEEPANG